MHVSTSARPLLPAAHAVTVAVAVAVVRGVAVAVVALLLGAALSLTSDAGSGCGFECGAVQHVRRAVAVRAKPFN